MMWDILFPGITRPNSPYLWIAAPDLRRAHTMFERFLRSGAVWSVVDQWLPHDVDDGMRQQAHRNIQQSVQSYLEFWGHQEAISVVQRPVVDSAYSSQLSQPRTPTVLRNNSSGALQTNYSLVRQVVPADAIREPQIHNQSISTFPESLDEEESSGD